MHPILLAHTDSTIHPQHSTQPWATFLPEQSPFSSDTLSLPSEPRLILWSGTPADELFERDLRAWGPPAWERFMKWCQDRAPELRAAGCRILWRPHARHVLSDVQRCLRAIAEWDAAAFGLILDAPSFLELPMLPKAPDHLLRAFETLGPRAEAVWIHSVQPPADPDDDAPLTSVLPGDGIPDLPLLTQLIRSTIPPATPLIIPALTPPDVFAAIAPSRYT